MDLTVGRSAAGGRSGHVRCPGPRATMQPYRPSRPTGPTVLATSALRGRLARARTPVAEHAARPGDRCVGRGSARARRGHPDRRRPSALLTTPPHTPPRSISAGTSACLGPPVVTGTWAVNHIRWDHNESSTQRDCHPGGPAHAASSSHRGGVHDRARRCHQPHVPTAPHSRSAPTCCVRSVLTPCHRISRGRPTPTCVRRSCAPCLSNSPAAGT